MNNQESFIQIVKKPFQQVSKDMLKDFIIYFWTDDSFIPDLSSLSEPIEKQRACYFIDKLSRFHCVGKNRKNKIRNILNDYSFSSTKKENIDPLALKWGLYEDLKQEFKELLQYQTRHFLNTYKGIKND